MRYKVAVFPGDGVGPELIDEGMKVIDKAAELDKFEIEWVRYLYSAEYYLETKELLSAKALKEIKNSYHGIYCGTFDSFRAEDSKTNDIAGTIRDYFDQFIILRPIRLLPSVESILAHKSKNEIDFVIIRENSEDFYVGAAGRAKNGKNSHQIEMLSSAFKAKFDINIDTKGNELAYQIGVLSKKGCERAVRYSFEYAKRKNCKKITFIDKANLLDYYNFWRENIENIRRQFAEIEYEFTIVDAAVINFIRQPEKYKIVVAPNMFGDILSDLGTMLQGGLSFAAQANINPGGVSMFEPIHGSAPKLKGQGIVNPIATIWAGALMLENIGQQKSGDLIVKAIDCVLKDGKTRTQDLDGNNTTSEMTEAIIDKLIEIHE